MIYYNWIGLRTLRTANKYFDWYLFNSFLHVWKIAQWNSIYFDFVTAMIFEIAQLQDITWTIGLSMLDWDKE